METITVDRKIILDLAKGIEDLNNKIESLELSSDPKFMESLRESKEQILKSFDLSQIKTYVPEYDAVIAAQLAK